MVRLELIVLLLCAFLTNRMDCKKTYGDMFPHKHKSPFPFPIPGWDPDTNPWDESLYPPPTREVTRRHHGKARVRLTSDSPAMNGSLISFSARLEFPPCQREDPSGELRYEPSCGDNTEASANGQLRSGYVFNWTSWLDDYGFGKCTDLKTCNVFPDGKPFPQHNDWRRRNYVYVWHTMGQYFETCDGSSSSLTLNTTNWTFGSGVMEVMVYRKRERRKYSPLSTDSSVFFITDKIPLAVNISQKEAANISEHNVFLKGYDIVFNVQLHDPSGYLKTADAVDFMWDFRDGNQLVTHSNVATHAYGVLGNVTVKLVVEAAFRTACPPPTPTPMHFTHSYTTAAPTHPPVTTTSKMATTEAASTAPSPTTVRPAPGTTHLPTTEPLPSDPGDITSSTATGSSPPPMMQHSSEGECFRYMYGNFEDQIFIIETPPALHLLPPNRIVDVSAAKLSNTTVNFLVTCSGSAPSLACTTVSDSTCRQVLSVLCDEVKPAAAGCQVSLKRSFQEPGVYCVNITLGVPGGITLASTTVTIGNGPHSGSSGSPHVAEVVLSSTAVLVVIFAVIAFMMYKRYKVYRPVRRSVLEDAEGRGQGGRGLSKLRAVLFSANEERSRLLTDRRS